MSLQRVSAADNKQQRVPHGVNTGPAWRSVRVAGVPLWLPALVCLPVLLFGLAKPLGKAVGVACVPLVFCGLWFERMRRKTGRALRRSEYRLSVVVNHAVDALIAIDERGLIEHFNPASERIFGYAVAEVLGRDVEMLMSEPQAAEGSGGLLRYFSACEARPDGTAGCEVRARRKDGSTFPMELVLSGFALKDGRYIPAILRDISVRKQVEERKALLAAIVASSEDAIVSETLDGIVTSWNGSAERLLGYSAEEAVGKHVNLIIPPEELDEERQILERLRNGEEIQRAETTRLNKNGQRLCVSLTLSPVRNTSGRVIGASKIMRDITARKESEAALLGYMKALEVSNQELDDFAYIASHDLKEPLRGLFNNATFLQEDYEDKLDEQGVKRLHRIRFLTQRMERLVHDLLYFSRLGRQELAIQPTDLNATIHDIASMMETTLREQNAAVTIPRLLPELVCDKTGIAEIFRNLITNAVKYNAADEKIVEVGFIDQMGTKSGVETQVFYVRDNGIGISPEFHEDIFRMFKRLNDEDEARKGTGVGLTFVRKILDRHGGRIWLESAPGQGTTFYFTLKPSAADATA